MKLKFEPNLQYQKDAIESVINLFEGNPYLRPEDRISQEVAPNIWRISSDKIFENYDKMIESGWIASAKQTRDDGTLDFTIEMETGTGKTYIYLRTIIELYKKYGFTKFLIVVPNIAVKEGVIKTLEITQSHFKELYNENINYFEYDSKHPTRIRNFAMANSLQIMVTNIQAFNTDDRIINQEKDQNNGVKLIELIRAVHPIIIMDEPQEGMDSANMQKRFAQLEPLFKLRYSATHKNPINLVHKLTPYDAYNQGLVKKIELYSINEENTQSNVDIEFIEMKLTTTKPEARLRLNYKVGADFKQKDGNFKELDNLERKTKNPSYKGWIVERIYKDLSDNSEKIKFSNGTELVKGTKHGWDKELIFREQIRWTIKRHFQKKDKFKDLGIKVLSLFFIDRVANYVQQDGIIRCLFIEEYTKEYRSRYKLEPTDIEKIHNGYFAKTKQGEYTDNENSISKNKEIYNKIMKDKEVLLSMEEPLEFIFSHSALGVGWDNPNVFQICTLNETHSENKKRQEIGRGLRICVDKSGERYRDSDSVAEGEEVNLLTVIPNESYHAFISTYQNEIIDETGDSRQVKVRDGRKGPKTVNLNKDILNSDDFKKLWEKLQKKTKYMVSFREEELIEKCSERLNEIIVKGQEVKTHVIRLNRLSDNINDGIGYLGDSTTRSRGVTAAIDFVDQLSEQTTLSVQTVSQILKKVSNKMMLSKNPIMYLTEAVKKIKSVLEEEMVRVVSYKEVDEIFSISEFEKYNRHYAKLRFFGNVWNSSLKIK